MGWRGLFSEAVASLKFYRRRTIVTILSLAWGVACFVILMSYGNGFDRALRSAFHAVGQDLIIMGPGQTSQQAGGMRSGRPIRLELDDVNVIREAVPSVRAISPERTRWGMTVVRGTREKAYTVRAVWPEYESIRNMKVVEGRWISLDDNHNRNRVAVLGATVARELFSGIPPVGEEITMQGQRFTVIGVLEAKGQLANYNTPDNECIFIPYDTVALFGDIRYPSLIVWTPVSPQARDKAIRDVRATLATIHHFKPTDDKAVEILAFSEFMYIIDGLSLAFRMLLGFVGALTLGIGGVGLANIMLATVLERTREIGVLKALGGPRRTVLGQFFFEALLVVAIGGALGILVGSVAAYAVNSMPLFGALWDDAPDKGNVQLHISAASVLVSTGVLLFIGLIAGMIPAIKAARLDPIEALRYE
jgi:putative ABC transport system permease protein